MEPAKISIDSSYFNLIQNDNNNDQILTKRQIKLNPPIRKIFDRKAYFKNITKINDLKNLSQKRIFESKLANTDICSTKSNTNQQKNQPELILDSRTKINKHCSSLSDTFSGLSVLSMKNQNSRLSNNFLKGSKENKHKKQEENDFDELDNWESFYNTNYNMCMKENIYNESKASNYNNCKNNIKQKKYYKAPSKSIYKLLSQKKNDFMEHLLTPDNDEMKKINKKIKILYESNPPSNYLSPKVQKKNFFSAVTEPPIALITKSNLKFYSTSEKNRFHNYMEIFNKLKTCIDLNKTKEFDILKEFLLNHGIYEKKYFKNKKLVNLLNFLHTENNVNSKLNFKQILLDILNKNDECINNDYIKNVENEKEREKIPKKILYKKNKLADLAVDLDFQKKMAAKECLMNRKFDLVNKPRDILLSLGVEFSNNELPKVSKQFSNTRLYGVQKSNLDFDVLKKRNKLTEFFCLTRAKNFYEKDRIKRELSIK